MDFSQSRYSSYVSTVLFTKKGQGVTVTGHHHNLIFWGMGRSAVVFKIKGEDRVIKIFYPPFEKIALEEQRNYEKVKGNHFYPNIYESGANYLVMDFIDGKTFFQCLAEGIPLKKNYVEQVDNALQAARRSGLNPSDIHLHNLIVTKEEHVRIIDIARFSQKKQCSQWDDLKSSYERHYHRFYFPKKVPKWIMNAIAKLYRLLKSAK